MIGKTIRLGIGSLALILGLPMAQSQLYADTDTALKTHEVFDIFRAGNKIGTNNVDILQRANNTAVKITTDVHVKVMYVEVYHYQLTSLESWKNNELIGFRSETDDNGQKHLVS